MSKHSRKPEPNRPLAMSEGAAKVVRSLAQLGFERTRTREKAASRDEDSALEEVIGRLIRVRRSRLRYIPAGLLGEPVWHIALLLLHAEVNGRCLSVASICEESDVPEQVARRWLEAMVEHGLVTVRPVGDEREELVELVADVSVGLRRSLGERCKQE